MCRLRLPGRGAECRGGIGNRSMQGTAPAPPPPAPAAYTRTSKAYRAILRTARMDDAERPTTKVTVLVGGSPEERILDDRSTVKEIIANLLPEYEKTRADDYALSPENGPPLDPGSRLGDDDIPDGSVLALTKMDGGGGACSGR